MKAMNEFYIAAWLAAFLLGTSARGIAMKISAYTVTALNLRLRIVLQFTMVGASHSRNPPPTETGFTIQSRPNLEKA
jgi:hypothetical protein